MKKFIILSLCLLTFGFTLKAQTKINLGAGYFGHTISHPGFVFEAEWEKSFSENASLPIRINLGGYKHNRYHTGLFLDVHAGFRQYHKSGFFLEESIGLGIFQAILNSDAVYEVDESGAVQEAGRWLPQDLSPSITLGLGYNLGQGSGKTKNIWLRPKLFWQYPHKTSSTYHLAIQAGYTATIN